MSRRAFTRLAACILGAAVVAGAQLVGPSTASASVATAAPRILYYDASRAAEFIDAYAASLTPVIAGYERENKRHSTVAVGCTGGKHRSVATAIELASRLRSIPGLAVRLKHRDLGRE